MSVSFNMSKWFLFDILSPCEGMSHHYSKLLINLEAGGALGQLSLSTYTLDSKSN